METSSNSKASSKGLATFLRCLKEVRSGIHWDMSLGHAMRVTVALAEQFKSPGAEAADLLRQVSLDRLRRVTKHDVGYPAAAKKWHASANRCLQARGDWNEVKYLSWLVIAPAQKVSDRFASTDDPETAQGSETGRAGNHRERPPR